MKNLLPLLFILSVTACQYPAGLKEIKTDRFAIKVTGYMDATEKLHPEADFQYENRYRTVYLLVLDTVKTPGMTLDSFGRQALATLATGSVRKVKWNRIDSVTSLNGVPARQYEQVMYLTGEDVYFDLVAVEAKDRFYQVLGWTIMRRKDKYAKDINDMVTSFRLL